MRATHLSRLRLAAADLEDLALLHCEWALGLDRFATLREGRLASGLPADARPSELLGEHGNRWSFRFSVPAEQGKRTSAVRLAAMQDGVMVEHLVVFEGPAPVEPTADSPETTRWLLAFAEVRPAMLARLGPLFLGEREVAGMVAQILEPGRAAPMVLISVDNASREPLVEPRELARRLAGMAEVVCLSTVATSRRYKDELVTQGFSEKFGCYHGGVRILWPGIQREDNPYDHPLLLPVRLEAFPAAVRAERVAGLFCEMITEAEDLRAWLRELDTPVRPEPSRRQSPHSGGRAVVQRHPVADAPPPADAGAPTSAGTASTSQASRTAATVAEAPSQAPLPAPTVVPDLMAPPPPTRAQAADAEEQQPRAQRGETQWSRLAGDVAAAAQLAEELEDELEELRRELGSSRKAQRRAEQERDEAVEARFVANTVADALALAEASFSERLIALASARASAEASPFRQPSLLFHVLTLLALFGRHDGEMETALDKVLGAQARWRPKDSSETTARFGRERTWVGSDGARKLFRRHITLGHGVDDHRCAQVYYDVAHDGRIELAWVGGHRPTVSEDT